MKNFVIIVLILCLPMMLLAQEKKATANKLKSITVYEQKFEKGPGKVLIESVIEYDQAGNIIKEIEYKDGKVVKHFTYRYDNSHNKIQETEMDPSGKKIKETGYKYNSNNLRTEKIVYDANDRILSKKIYKYETY